ncbi:MAG TPA: F390 synthetase-related protein [Ktedonobacteraceae bacterium]|nr:F390 synthetase-related protein [Ktedonobacteraceae bacterium]
MNVGDTLLVGGHFARARWRWKHLRGEALKRYQERRARAMVAYAERNSPFYRDHWAGQNLRDWRALPTVDKQLMMAHFDTFNTRGIGRDEAMRVALEAERSRDFRPVIRGLTVGLSSGTSGHRGLFLVSRREQAAWAGTILARTLHHLPRGRLRVAFFLRSNSNLYEQVSGTLIQFRYFDLMLPLAEAVAALNDFQPHILVGPPSLLGFLASEREQGRLRCQPGRLISVAEVLEPQDEQRIAGIFDAPVHQIYQCTEGLLAVSCERGSLHVQEDGVALQYEPLPDDKIAEGEREAAEKRVMPIVTDLWRRTQPIIRYRLNDVLRLDSRPCSCGSAFQVIRSIEGRCDDVCHFASLDGDLRPFYPDTLRRMALLASPDIADYQVAQESQERLYIRLMIVPGASFESVEGVVRESANEMFKQYGCRMPEVVIEEGLEPLAPGVKRRRVVTKVGL